MHQRFSLGFTGIIGLSFIGGLALAAPNALADAPATSSSADSPLIAHLTKVASGNMSRKIDAIQFDKFGLRDCLDYLRTIGGTNFTANWRDLAVIGIFPDTPVTVNLSDQTLADVLNAICDSVAAKKLDKMGQRILQFGIVNGDIVLDTSDRYRSSIKAHSSASSQLSRKLPAIKYRGNGFDEALGFLQDISGAEFQVDWDALQAAHVTKATPITATFVDATLAEILATLLHSLTKSDAPIGYIADGPCIIITTKDSLATFSPGPQL